MNRKPLVLVLMMLAATGWTQESPPRISIGLIEAGVSLGNTGIPLVQSIQSALRVTLTMANAGEIIQTDFLRPHVSLPRAYTYFQQEDISRAVYGNIDRVESGGLLISLWVWSNQAPNSPRRFERSVDSAFDVFDVADELGLEIASSIVGRRLVFGQVIVAGTVDLAAYSIYVDGQRIAANQSRVQVLSGTRDVIVAVPGPLGDQPLQRFEVVVPENGTVAVELTESPEPDDGEQQPEASTAQTLEEVGSLRVESEPAGAAVLLDNELLGQTPLDIYGVPVGRYELVVERDLFRPVTQVIDVQARQTSQALIDLEVDENHPDVAAAMVTPSRATWAAGTGILVRAGITLVPVAFFGRADGLFEAGSFLDWMVLTAVALPGHLYSGNLSETALTSAIGAAAILTAMVLPQISGGMLRSAELIAFLVPGLLNIYDLVGAPGAARRENARVLAHIKTAGSLPGPRAVSRRVVLEVGGGPVLSAGYRLPVVRGYFFLRPSVGLLLAATEAPSFGASGAVAAELVPLGRQTGTIRPSISVLGQVEYLLSHLAYAVGYEYGLSLVLSTIDITATSRTTFGLTNGTFARRFAVGVRL